jgi:hypothetical protein
VQMKEHDDYAVFNQNQLPGNIEKRGTCIKL